MSGFGILFIIFGVCVFLTGLYAFTGHKIAILTERPSFKNIDINDWKNIGKWTMITSILIIIIGVLGIILNIE